jgi:TRAP transporter 4TM/12TM fusion protein
MSIPLMKRLGYRPTLAAAIEAASSVGGAIMPPVMGAAAFVMAEMIARPYADIMKAAALGAVLYYLGILFVVHFESKRLGVRSVPREELPKGRDLLRDAHLVLPLVLLVVLMSARFSSYFAAFWSVVALVAVAGLRAHTRMGRRKILDALVIAGKTIAVLSVAIAAAGIITAGLTNTGLLLAFMGLIRDTAGGSLLLLVLLIAATCLFLGTGIPTTPAYIVTSAIGAPLLAEHGVPLLAIHLFVFYFAVLADASPPVAPAADVAAAIAGAPPLQTGVVAFRLATGGFITGIAFIYEPALILNGTLFEIVSIFLAIAGGLVLLAIADTGYADAPVRAAWRWVLLAAGLFCGLAHSLPAWQRALLALTILAVIKLRTLARRKADRRLALTGNATP